MFKIGDFSRLSKITVKTLRFYDDEGLLKPQEVDKWTNYRYYSSDQLFELQRILALRQAGLSIADVKAIISGDDVELILQRRRAELEREKLDAEARFLRINGIINDLKEGNKMEFQAIIKQIPECTVFYGVKKLQAFEQLNEFICGLGAECAAANPKLKCVSPEYCFVSYLDEEFVPNDFTAMYAQAVEHSGVETENVKFKTMPAITAVSVMVRGAYMPALPNAYAFTVKWIEENGYEIAGRAREVYIDGIWNKDNPADYLTEIQFPVRKK